MLKKQTYSIVVYVR